MGNGFAVFPFPPESFKNKLQSSWPSLLNTSACISEGQGQFPAELQRHHHTRKFSKFLASLHTHIYLNGPVTYHNKKKAFTVIIFVSQDPIEIHSLHWVMSL